MEIRNLQEEDIEEVVALAKECEELAVERDSIYWMFWKFFRGTCFVVLEKGNVVGLLLGFVDQVEGKIGFIHELGVAAEFREQGIASGLIGKFEEAVQEKGGERICLTTLPENVKAIGFYEKRGFDEKSEIYKAGGKRVQFCKKISP